MPDPIKDMVSGPWKDIVDILSIPIAWVPDLQQTLFNFFLDSSGWLAAFSYILLFFPVLEKGRTISWRMNSQVICQARRTRMNSHPNITTRNRPKPTQ